MVVSFHKILKLCDIFLQAIANNRLFILNHHDTLMPYLRRINTTNNKIYASRTLLFLNTDGTLKPIAIELSLPNPLGDKFGADSKVYTPAEQGVENGLWQLAKAYVAVNDSGVHQLISHWYTYCLFKKNRTLFLNLLTILYTLNS